MAPRKEKTVFTIVRHGESLWNAEGLQQGQLDSPLSPLGIRQAEAIARWCGDSAYDGIISSDLGRAMATARIIAKKLSLPIEENAFLRERNMGIIQGMTLEEFSFRYPDESRAFHSDDIDYIIPSGESVRQRAERSIAAMEEIAFQHRGERLVVVTHGGILNGFFKRAVGLDLGAKRHFSLYNAAINELSILDETWELNSWGLTDHLKGIGTQDDH